MNGLSHIVFDVVEKTHSYRSDLGVNGDEVNMARTTPMFCSKSLREQGYNPHLAAVLQHFITEKYRKEDIGLLGHWEDLGAGNEERKSLIERYVRAECLVNVINTTNNQQNRRIDRLVKSVSEPDVFTTG